VAHVLGPAATLPAMSVVLGIDAGSTRVRTVALGADGAVRASSSRELASHFPRPGWVEQDPQEIWRLVQATAAEVAAWAGDRREPVAAIGVTNQRETAMAWDKETGRPLNRAISWQDRRTAARCRELAEAGHLPEVRARTGLLLDAYFSATKWAWLLDHVPLPGASRLALGTVDAWIVWNLTGGPDGGRFATDPSNASRTLLYDIVALRWSEELCALFGVPSGSLPEVLPSSGRLAETRGSAGLPAGIPVSAAVGDQQAALFGQACFFPGMAKATFGTGSFVLVNVGAAPPPPADGVLGALAWELGGRVTYALEGPIFSTGATIQWLRDGLGLVAEVAEAGSLAGSVPSTEGVHLVPAFTGLGSPWWDPDARGAVVGLSPGVGRAHLARAAVEAMAYQTRDVLDAVAAAWGHPAEELRVDGGASVMDLLLQLLADQLGVPVLRGSEIEATARGAAYLAGLAEGVWASLEEVAANWTQAARFEPGPGRGGADARQAAWHRAVERARSFRTPG
jgi:glycerol kinase